MINLSKTYLIAFPKKYSLLSSVGLMLSFQVMASEVSIYTAHGPEITSPIIQRYKEQFPDTKVNVMAISGTGEMMARIESEVKNPLGDVAWGGSNENYMAAGDNVFASVKLKNDDETIAQDPNHKWHATDVLLQTIVVNTDLVKNPDTFPNSFLDLTDPKWRDNGMIVFANPRSSGTTYSLLAAMVTQYNWQFLDDFLPNAKIVDNSSAMVSGVRTGEYPVGFINEDLAHTWFNEGVPIHIVYPSDIVSNQIGAAAIIANSKNSQEAEQFINFLMSKEAQELMVKEINRRSSRMDVAAPEGLADISKLNLAKPDPKLFANDKKGVLAKFDEHLQRVNNN